MFRARVLVVVFFVVSEFQLLVVSVRERLLIIEAPYSASFLVFASKVSRFLYFIWQQSLVGLCLSLQPELHRPSLVSSVLNVPFQVKAGCRAGCFDPKGHQRSIPVGLLTLRKCPESKMRGMTAMERRWSTNLTSRISHPRRAIPATHPTRMTVQVSLSLSKSVFGFGPF